jgi:hypothetical protein
MYYIDFGTYRRKKLSRTDMVWIHIYWKQGKKNDREKMAVNKHETVKKRKTNGEEGGSA